MLTTNKFLLRYKKVSVDDEFDFNNNLIITGAIRSGKTELAINEIICKRKVVYVCRSHEQCKDVVKRLDKFGIATVHVAGEKKKEFEYETDYSLTPKDFYEKWRDMVKRTGKKIPQIKYVEHLLKIGYIDVVVTVPELFVQLNPTDVLVVDELTTLKFFHQKPILLREFYRNPKIGLDYTLCNVKRVKNQIKIDLDELIQILDDFPKMIDEFRESCKHPEKAAAAALEVVLKHYLNNLKIEFDEKTIKKQDDELAEIMFGLMTYSDVQVITGREGVKIWLIPNKDEILFKDQINKFKEIIVVVDEMNFDKGRQFLENLGRSYKTIKTEPFRYSNNFIPIKTDDVFEAGKWLYNLRVPTIWIIGRDKDMKKLKNELKERGMTNVIDGNQMTREELREKALQGQHIVIYLNSAISKGIDLPEFHAVIVYSVDFATPDDEHYSAVQKEMWQTNLRVTPCGWQSRVERKMLKFVVFNEQLPKEVCSCLYLPKEPIFIGKNEFKSIKSFQPLFSKRTEERRVLPKQSSSNRDREPDEVIISLLTYKTTIDERLINQQLFVATLFSEKTLKGFLNLEIRDIIGILHNLNNKLLSRTEVYNVFKKYEGLRNEVLINKILQELERNGLVTKFGSKGRGKQTIYRFKELTAYFPQTDELIGVED